jgi:hypothetical protein
MEGAEMSRTRKIIGALAALLAAAALIPGVALGMFSASAVVGSSTGGPEERTATELGQAVGEPGEQRGAATGLNARTPTELGQSVAPAATVVESTGFDWGDAAIGAGAGIGLALIALAGVVLASRRRHVIPGPSTPAVSS